MRYRVKSVEEESPPPTVEKCRGRECSVVVCMCYRVKVGRERPVVVFMSYQVKSVEEESAQLLVLCIIE